MNFTEIASNTVFYRAPDGRIVFRPWGPGGPCYLLTEEQRVVRARVQLAYYGAMLLAISSGFGNVSNAILFGAVLPGFIVGNYALFWAFTRSLARTTPPPKPTREYFQAQIRRSSHAFGRPLLWVMFAGSTGFVLLGITMAMLGGAITDAALTIGFFGLCAAVFAWMLRAR